MKKRNNLLIRRISIAALCAGMIFSVPSCKKYTNLLPVDALSNVTSFSTAANVELAAAGMYNAAAVGNYSGAAGRGYTFGGASIEQSEMRGDDMVNIASFYQITYQATYDATTANNQNIWVNCYALINQANTFIAGVQTALAAGVLTPASAAAYQGEACFLRALSHHELVINYCRPYADGAGSNPGVPYRTLAINSQTAVAAGVSETRGTVAQDYTAILADLAYAEANLPAALRATNGITRASVGAAIALESRVRLHMGDWAGVIAAGAKLGVAGNGPVYNAPMGPTGGYRLTASPDGPFYSGIASITPTNNGNNTESIFSIEESSQANGGVNGSLPEMFGTSDRGGRGLVCTSPNLYNASFWVSSDTRRTLLQVKQNVAGAMYYFNFKYRDIVTQSDFPPILRYAEVLLNVAEANSRLNNLTPALAMLNAVRNRAVAVADQYNAASFTTSLAMTQAILNERRIEFAGEGRRWGDISRLALDPNFSTGGIPGKILIGQISGTGSSYDIVNRPIITTFGQAAIPYANFKFIWPIPSVELAVNPTLAQEQNPFY